MDPIGSTTWEVNWREVEAEGERKMWEMLREEARGEVDHLEVMEVNSTGRNENTAEMGRYYEGVARTVEEHRVEDEDNMINPLQGALAIGEMGEMISGEQMEEDEQLLEFRLRLRTRTTEVVQDLMRTQTEEEYWRQVEVDGERGMWEMVRGGQMEEEENVQQWVELNEADNDDVIVLDDSDNEINNDPGDLGTVDESQCDINDLATVSRGSSRSSFLRRCWNIQQLYLILGDYCFI